MKTILTTRYIDIPKNVEVDFNARCVTVKGPRGTLFRDFKHLTFDMQRVDKRRLRVDIWFGKRKQVKDFCLINFGIFLPSALQIFN